MERRKHSSYGGAKLAHGFSLSTKWRGRCPNIVGTEGEATFTISFFHDLYTVKMVKMKKPRQFVGAFIE
jgi:hypothetical protein